MQYKKTEAQRKWHSWLADRGCVITQGPAEIHHVVGASAKQKYHFETHWIGQWYVLPLCYELHRSPNVEGSIAKSRNSFERIYGPQFNLFLNKVQEYYNENNVLPFDEDILRAIGEHERQREQTETFIEWTNDTNA